MIRKTQSIFSPGRVLTALGTLAVVIALPVVLVLITKQQDLRQHAASGNSTATINVSPSAATVNAGQNFSVDVVIDGGGQLFNAAQANVTLSSNLSVQSLTITPASSGGCNFVFVGQNTTPTATNPSFAGAILNASSSHCTLYTLNLHANTTGAASINLTNGSVKAFADNSEILQFMQSGSYTIISTPTPTPVPPNSATLFISPNTQTVAPGQTVTATVNVDSGSSPINALQTTISYPAGLLTETGISYGGAFGIQAVETIASGSISIARGTITPVTGQNAIATITFHANSAGNAPISLSNSQVYSSTNNQNIFSAANNGTIVIAAPTPTPTLIPTSIPTSTPFPTPTSIQQPTTTASPTSSVPTSTPAPTSGTLQPPTINPQVSDTYSSLLQLGGSKTSITTLVFVNNSSVGIAYPNSTTWQLPVALVVGVNNFVVGGQDGSGNNSSTNSISIKRHKLGDINGDNNIDLTDLSLFGVDWQNTGTLNSALSDMNNDNAVDLTDFSIIAKAYGN